MTEGGTMSRTSHQARLVAGLATAILAVAAAPAAAGPGVTVRQGPDAVTVAVDDGTRYEVRLDRAPFAITTVRSGATVLGTSGGGLRFRTGDTWQHATALESATWDGTTLHARLATTSAAHRIALELRPGGDRYALDWSVEGDGASALGLEYDLGSAGRWYGHGEAQTAAGGPYTDQPWPLDAGRVRDTAFSPASYLMIDPFWYTSSAVGLHVDTGRVMDVAINDGADGLGRFTIADPGAYHATVFVERSPLEVYRDYIGVVGKPEKSDPTYEQYEKPMWNSWAQFYTNIDQASLLGWAEGIHANGLDGHAVQLDDKWESNYGNLTFDPTTFPDPKAMSDRIHEMGSDMGLWVTLWINLDSTNYQFAADHGYLIASKDDPDTPCEVTWWNGTAGIVDLANPEAKAWYEANLRKLMADYGVDGFKFDTRFFDERCRPRPGFEQRDYQRLGAEMADQFDLQGAGIRVHWSGAQRHGFLIRQVDKGTGWNSLDAAVKQNLALSTIGYPFVETDMIGGSLGQPPPAKEVLVRWAQAAALMPLMYSSSSPLGVREVMYDEETVALYREAIERHGRLAPYIWDQVRGAVASGDPIMRPLFFDFPRDERTYVIDDEWMLGPAVLAAPAVRTGDTRDVYLPEGRWLDVNHSAVINGPRLLRGYGAPLGVSPAFVRLGAKGAGDAIKALRDPDAPPASAWIEPAQAEGTPVDIAVNVGNWDARPLDDVRVALTVPDGWTAQPRSATQFAHLQSGERATATWRVTAPADARWAAHELAAAVTYRGGEAAARSEVTIRPQPGVVSPPFRTLDTTGAGARFAQSGDQFAFWAGGRDWSGGMDEKAAIYRDAALGEHGSVTTHVVDHDGGGPAGKAGVVVANDVGDTAAGGYVMLTMSRDYGPELMWDSDGNGWLDGWKGGGPSRRPVWLRLTRDGTAYTGSISTDGQSWSEVGTVTVPSAAGAQDAGMGFSAVNLFYPGVEATGVFDAFAVQ
jgi:alpha-glucosidase (family GH31 glycosyl hydrolase)